MALETATWMSFPQINAFVYTELQSGRKRKLNTADLKKIELPISGKVAV